eukprot:scaffold71_cov265-Chaetoceros_neogracile.AAC.37
MCRKSQSSSNVSSGIPTTPDYLESLPIKNSSNGKMRVSRSNDDLMALKREIEKEMDLRDDSTPEGRAQYPLWKKLTPRQQFLTLTTTMFLFFGVHNVLQEAMMKVPGFNGIMLSYMEVLG